MPDPRRQLVGRRSKASGETFERWISNACEFYLQNGWAHIEKTPEPFHITGKDRDGTVKGYYEKKGQPDYKGILCDGTGIMFEAKHTDSDRIRQNVVTDTQWESLDIYEKFGAHCYVMVSLGLTKFYRVPWATWKKMKELFCHKFMTEQELEPYRLQEKQCTILILEGVELKDENTENGACNKAPDEDKMRLAIACQMNGIDVRDIETGLANVLTGVQKAIKPAIEYYRYLGGK